MDSTNTDTVSKKSNVDTHAEKNNVQNDTRDSNSNEKQDNMVQGKDKTNKIKKQKRKNLSKADDDVPNVKKIKINAKNEDSPTKAKKGDKKVALVKKSTEKKSKKEKKKLRFDQTKSGQLNVEQIMSLNAERLKTYGLNAKKFKNKLKYGNKKF